MLADAAKMFVVVTEFEAYRLFVSSRVDKFETRQTLMVPTFAVVANTFVVVTAFDAYTLPVTLIPVTPVAGVTTTFDATTFP